MEGLDSVCTGRPKAVGNLGIERLKGIAKELAKIADAVKRKADHTGERTLDRHNIPERVVRLAQPDEGPSHIRSNRRRTFLDKPLTWTPTTWIFHDTRHAFALNYGEVNAVLLQALLDNARADWSGH